MPAAAPVNDIVDRYPALEALVGAGPLPGEVARLTVPAGTVLFDELEPCKGFPLLLRGEVAVSQGAGDGRRLELYRVVPGELCLVSSSCIFGAPPLPARGVATQPTELLVVPPAVFLRWLADASFRGFVMGLFAQRMTEMAELVEAVAFHRLDQRLAAALLGRGTELAMTHQQLAEELGTVREMVTRLLRRFEREGWIELARERIRIVDSAALRRAASVT